MNAKLRSCLNTTSVDLALTTLNAINIMNETTTFKVGDPVTYTIYTDRDCGWVKEVSPNGKTILVEFAEQKLLNGANSGAPDALQFEPGGFCGHTSGEQRWEITRAQNPAIQKFTLRKNGVWKMPGNSSKSPGCVLTGGHHPYYDFNF